MEIRTYLLRPVSIFPLVIFRILFGLLMAVSLIRFMAYGWVDEFYIQPLFHFHYYGFEWIEPLRGQGMYWIFSLMLLSCFCIIVGLFYRLNMLLFFLLFTYVELIDKALYLNHYYFISILSFLLIFLPLHHNASIDTHLFPKKRQTTTPFWTVFSIQLLLAIVYFFAGVAKLKYDWLWNALPLKIWLNARSDFPFIGTWFEQDWFAYAMSWGGAIYDLTIPFLLWMNRTRKIAYLAVIIFHIMTYSLFNIGMFPFIMIATTSIFFSASQLKKLPLLNKIQLQQSTTSPTPSFRLWKYLFVPFFIIQILFPLRHFLYSGNVLWTEEGFRFSWKVMLVEKTAYLEYRVISNLYPKGRIIYPADFLTKVQVKQMSFQPDMILEFAHYLDKRYSLQGHKNIRVFADCWVSINGRPNKRLIDANTPLNHIQNSLTPKTWILKEYSD